MTHLDPWPLMRDFGPAALRLGPEVPPGPEPDPAAAPGALIDHILERYHRVHRAEFPDAIRLARKVEAVHAEHAQVPNGLADCLSVMFDELEAHQRREELILFPTIRSGGCAIIAPAIARMMSEHEDQAAQLQALRALTAGYTPPEDACRTWHALYDACRKLDEDLTAHMRLENEQLFAPLLG